MASGRKGGGRKHILGPQYCAPSVLIVFFVPTDLLHLLAGRDLLDLVDLTDVIDPLDWMWSD